MHFLSFSRRSLVRSVAAILLLLAVFSPGYVQAQASVPLTKAKWFKGNTHTHTLKSDGDSTPEEVTKWYSDNGYNFLFITDHETITPVDELNQTFGKADLFAVFTGQEVTDRLDGKPYHINGLGVSKVTMPQRGKTVVENLQLNVDSVRASGGIAQINHPNFGWALNVENIAKTKDVKLMELFNGHPLVNNLGGGGEPGVEEIWDKVLSSGRLIYGVASDDVHTVRKLGDRRSATPGHGWVMVRADTLSLRSIIDALERGDFYASTGVDLEDYLVDKQSISIVIKVERWSKYRVQFIGKNGTVLQETSEPTARYSVKGNEGYVRVRVIESNGKMAWTQPLMLTR